jgi:small GTP-binding protein
MVGESSVGKTALTIKFVNNKFADHAPATIGASFLSRTMKVKVPMKFNIWDTAGQEKYRSLASLYYRGADIAVIVYDITSRSSFEQVQDYWIQELKHQCFGDDGLVLALVGNKVDLSDRRQVEEAEGRRLADDFGALFFETSAKKTPSLDDLFLSSPRVSALFLCPPMQEMCTRYMYRRGEVPAVLSSRRGGETAR